MIRKVDDLIADACINSGVASTFGVDDIPDDVKGVALNILNNQILRAVSGDNRLIQTEEIKSYAEWHPANMNQSYEVAGAYAYAYGSGKITVNGMELDTIRLDQPDRGVGDVIRDGKTLTRVSCSDFVTVYKDREDVYCVMNTTMVPRGYNALMGYNAQAVAEGWNQGYNACRPMEVVLVWGNTLPSIVWNVPIVIKTIGGVVNGILDCHDCIAQYICDLLAFRLAATYGVSTVTTCKALCDMSLNSCMKPVRRPMAKADVRECMNNLMSRGRSLK